VAAGEADGRERGVRKKKKKRGKIRRRGDKAEGEERTW
jgi:hypothetical protein